MKITYYTRMNDKESFTIEGDSATEVTETIKDMMLLIPGAVEALKRGDGRGTPRQETEKE